VVILTSPKQEAGPVNGHILGGNQDVVRSHELGAPSYVSKPGNRHDFVSPVQFIRAFWFGCAYLMRKEDM
jgi:hypothetical protein